MTYRTLRRKYYSILAAVPERQHCACESISITGMVCNLFDNHTHLDYTVAFSAYMPPIMVLVERRT